MNKQRRSFHREAFALDWVRVFFFLPASTQHTHVHTPNCLSLFFLQCHIIEIYQCHHLLWLEKELDECVCGSGAVITVVVPGIITRGDLLNLS